MFHLFLKGGGQAGLRRTGPCCHWNSEMSIIPSVRLEASSSKCTGPAAAGVGAAAAPTLCVTPQRGWRHGRAAAGCTALSSGRAPQGGKGGLHFDSFLTLARFSPKPFGRGDRRSARNSAATRAVSREPCIAERNPGRAPTSSPES